jgi:predicted enzyme related to lactoylglutathione lyase
VVNLVIFAVDVNKVAAFYQAVLGVSPRPNPGDNKEDLRLCRANEEILIHSIPAHIAKTIKVQSPPIPRDESAMKPIFDVESLAESLAQVSNNGGVVTEMAFTLDGLTRHDVLDPEGNVIQLRGSL